MEKRYYTSTNWGPWMGIGFVLSTIFFGVISNGWLLLFLIFLSFLPAFVVALTLRGYFLIENNQIKYCFDRKKERQVDFAVSLVDVTSVKRVGKSVLISLEKEDDIIKRVHEADKFVHDLVQRNPRIEIV
ncbi:MAG: hypothetical protein JNL70_09875 [Saprospiraceae bacterium]|nr:hypothetical protein [Saprospiraceae bacterium]